MLGEPIATEQVHVAPISGEMRDHRFRLVAAQGARKHVSERRPSGSRLREHSLVHQVLGHRLVARHLRERATAPTVIARVAHLEQVVVRPDPHVERQRGRHAPGRPVIRPGVAHRLVGPHGRRLQCLDQPRLDGVDTVVAVHGFGHVPHGRLEREGARLLARREPAHAVGDHRDHRKPFIAERQPLMVGEAGRFYVYPLVDGGEQERVLIVAAHLSDVREAVDVELVIARLARRVGYGPARRIWHQEVASIQRVVTCSTAAPHARGRAIVCSIRSLG